jgi:FkbM family methyltransferase
MRKRIQQLRDLNCTRVVSFGLLFWKFADTFLPHYALDLPHKTYEQADEVRRALSVWADEASRREYLAQLRWRTVLDFDGLPPPVGDEVYFPTDLFALYPTEVFVDCGAFDGDTLRRFFRHQGTRFGGVIAFEPDPASFRKLQDYVSALPEEVRERVRLHQMAVGARREKVRFDAAGTEASAVGSGTLEVDSVTLDETLHDCVPTYIKMDTEGAELDALTGARRIIERDTPALALCLEHRQNDLWRIPLLVQSFSDQYRFFLRPHLFEVWDLTCYAVPAGRLAI